MAPNDSNSKSEAQAHPSKIQRRKAAKAATQQEAPQCGNVSSQANADARGASLERPRPHPQAQGQPGSSSPPPAQCAGVDSAAVEDAEGPSHAAAWEASNSQQIAASAARQQEQELQQPLPHKQMRVASADATALIHQQQQYLRKAVAAGRRPSASSSGLLKAEARARATQALQQQQGSAARQQEQIPPPVQQQQQQQPAQPPELSKEQRRAEKAARKAAKSAAKEQKKAAKRKREHDDDAVTAAAQQPGGVEQQQQDEPVAQQDKSDRTTTALLGGQPPRTSNTPQQAEAHAQVQLTAADLDRVQWAVRTVAAFLDARSLQELMGMLQYVGTSAELVPKRDRGSLMYCECCGEDLEDALLTYFMWDVGESSSSSPEQTVVCRGCFIVAFAMWWQQQGQPSDMRQQLTEKRRLQYDSWCRAAEALHSQRAAVGAPLLPLSRVQEQLFAGRQLLMGQQHWPVERCSCEPDVPGRLRAVVKRLVVRFGGEESWCTLPPLNELVRDRPRLTPCIPLVEQQRSGNGGDEQQQQQQEGGAAVSLSMADLAALVALLKHRVTKDDTDLAAAVVEAAKDQSDVVLQQQEHIYKQLLELQRQYQQYHQQRPQEGEQQQQQQQTKGRHKASRVAAGHQQHPSKPGRESGISDLQQYCLFEPTDLDLHLDADTVTSLSSADQAARTQLGHSCGSSPPSQDTRLVLAAITPHIQLMRQAADRTAAEGRASEAAARRFLAAALAARASPCVGEVSVQDLLTQALILLGGAGTGTRGHVDPASALTHAYAVEVPGAAAAAAAAARYKGVLAVWLFLSPAVFTTLTLLRHLLWLLQLLIITDIVAARREAVGKAEEKVKKLQGHGGAGGGGKQLRRPSAVGQQAHKVHQAAAAALTEAEASLAAHQQQYDRLKQQGWLYAGEQAADAAHTVKLTPVECQWLRNLLTFHKLSCVEHMQRIVEELGPQYACVLEQRGGEGVHVPCGWMHWVLNLQCCIKVAWEVVRPQQVCGAVQLHRHLRSRASDNPPDYLQLVSAAVQELLRWGRFL